MSTAMVRQDTSLVSAEIERVLMTGDLSKLTPDQRLSYYNATCKSLGLNPLTRPFDYIALNGKLTLYAKRDCTDQLRKVHKVSIKSVVPSKMDDLFVVVTAAEDADGRTDQSTGAVNIAGLKGEALANAMMKAETKSKRRVTLSICGLGMLDETEVETLRQEGVAEDYNQDQPPAGNNKAPIQQPQRASEKVKQETAAQTQAAPNPAPPAEAASEEGKTEGTVLISGKIDSMKPGKDNSLWMYIGSKLLVVFESKIDEDMKVGNVLTVKALRIQNKKVGEYFEVFSVLENPAVAETSQEQASPRPAQTTVVNSDADEAFERLTSAQGPAPTIDALKASGTVTTGNNISAPKTIGINQAKRLWAMMTQNSKSTGLTEDIVREQVLPLVPGHTGGLRDLDVKHKSVMEKLMTGEIDWKQYVKPAEGGQ